ncbi:hypothetical protein QEN19_001457 [Hanseniaspora menglaensis]
MIQRAFSAPGKALLVGGYLVLDQEYESYVVALSSRMHSVVESKPSDEIKVKVISSQFNNDTWEYSILKNSAGNLKPLEINGLKNPFVEKTILNVLNFFNAKKSNVNYEITIKIFSDPGFHSENESKVMFNGKKKFNFHKKTITNVPKTGLGSSACLVTVLTSALVSVFLNDFNVNNEENLSLIHNLAQVAHCQAQGKVGSGFDVAAATFGSILYQRFSADLINSLPSFEDEGINYGEHVLNLVNNTDWHFTHHRIQLPKGLRLIMGDVNTGSETTKLVAKVKAWYNDNMPESLNVYKSINDGNSKFISSLTIMNELAGSNVEEYNLILKEIEQGEFKHKVLTDISESILKIRSNFRNISKEGSVDIEPAVQTELLNNVIKQRGVLTAMIPGAGGYDAISIIATNDCNIKKSSDSSFENVTFLDLKQENFGLLEEETSSYDSFT